MKHHFLYVIAISLIIILAQRSYSSSSFSYQQQFVNSLVKPNDLVFDVGANIGKKAVLYINAGAHVVCVEPQPWCCQQLQARFADGKDIVIEQVGLASQEGTLDLHVCENADTISSFSSEWVNESRFTERGYQWNKTIKVPVTTLDKLIAKYGMPAFCKIDVENFEYEVLQGLTQPIPLLSFEFSQETIGQAFKCLDHLTSLGYKEFNFTIGENPAFEFTNWLDAAQMKTIIEERIRTGNHTKIWGLWGDMYARYS